MEKSFSHLLIKRFLSSLKTRIKEMDYISDNYKLLEEAEALEKLEKKWPQLLLENEKVVFPFRGRGGGGRDYLFFTDLRIIDIDTKGITGKIVKYKSISYDMVKAYSIETAGSVDSDVELDIYTAVKISYGFSLSTDIFALGSFLNGKILTAKNTGAEVPEGASPILEVKSSKGSNSVTGWLTGDNVQLDPKEVEAKMKSESNILMQDETVEMAFKCGRDSFLMTSKRLLKIDVQGLTGSRVSYLTILWKFVCAFEVETPGNFFDRDADITIFTSISDINRIDLDLKKGRGDYFALQKYFSNKVLGMDTVDASGHAPVTEGLVDKKPGFFAWIDNDGRAVDASVVNAELHSNPPVLQNCETVEMAFKARRDVICLTTKRLFVIDKQGFRGKKTAYLSIPWTCVTAFGVSTKGGGFDNDVELFVHTNINDVYYPPQQGDDPPPPPEPRNSYLEFSLVAKSVDILAVKRYMSERCILVQTAPNLLADTLSSDYILKTSSSSSASSFFDWIGGDARAVDPSVINQKLHEEFPILTEEEFVIMAFKCGRDMFIFTNKRIVEMDRKGFSGKKIAWTSMPYNKIHAYSVETAGSFDRDSELKLYGDFYWYDDQPCRRIKQDMRKGSVNVFAVENLISQMVIGNIAADPVAIDSKPNSGKDTFSAWMKDAASEMDPQAVNEKFHNDPAILQDDEVVEFAFKAVRDMLIYTNKRCLIVDVQGFSGKKVEFFSAPLHRCQGFAVQSAGALLSESKVTILSRTGGIAKIQKDLSKGVDIWKLQEFFAKKLL